MYLTDGYKFYYRDNDDNNNNKNNINSKYLRN